MLSDFRRIELDPSPRTLFIGNPPYVRHHRLGPQWKRWLSETAARMGLTASGLSGLHVHFFLATATLATKGDLIAYITAAEWLDVNYGRLVRDLFAGPLGGRRLVVVEPQARPFPDAATTAVVSYCAPGTRSKSVKVKRALTIEELCDLNANRLIRRERLAGEARWSHLTRGSVALPEGHVELGELCRVHRGQVTGANDVWIAGPHSAGLPDKVLFPSVTKARELFAAGLYLDDPTRLRNIIDLPADLDELDGPDRRAVEVFLKYAKSRGVDLGYVASNRRAWWSVSLREPAPILATYMARRPPTFVRNLAAARHINIAHGLYPRDSLSTATMDALTAYLASTVSTRHGRTYAGGLTKFEPREMERLLVPTPELLAERAHETNQ